MSITGNDLWLKNLTGALCKLGRAGFEEALFDLVNLAVKVDHCTVFINHRDGTTGHLFTRSRLDEKTCAALAGAYAGGFFAQDPNLAPLADFEGRPEGERLTVLDQKDPARYSPEYRARFFGDTGLIDKVSSVLETREHNIYCSFYRLRQSGAFTDGEFAELARLLPLLTTLIFKHFRMRKFRDRPVDSPADSPADPIVTRVPLGRSSALMSQLLSAQNEVFGRLTEREREVCARILQGYTSEAIALDLKVAVSTIHTYRKRAYAKLGISSQNELFSLCLEFMPISA